MLKRIFVSLIAGVLLPTVLFAQETTPPSESSQQSNAKQQAEPRQPPEPINVKIELTFTDQTGSGQPVTKAVSMIVANGYEGSIRSGGSVLATAASHPPAPGAVTIANARRMVNVTLNADARPVVLSDSRIRLGLSLEYAPKPSSENAEDDEGLARLAEQFTLIVDPGKPIVISQASDPTSDRRVTVELVATILK